MLLPSENSLDMFPSAVCTWAVIVPSLLSTSQYASLLIVTLQTDVATVSPPTFALTTTEAGRLVLDVYVFVRLRVYSPFPP